MMATGVISVRPHGYIYMHYVCLCVCTHMYTGTSKGQKLELYLVEYKPPNLAAWN